jgi:hypothetical protein
MLLLVCRRRRLIVLFRSRCWFVDRYAIVRVNDIHRPHMEKLLVSIGVTLCQTVGVAMVVQRCPDEILGVANILQPPPQILGVATP